MTSHDDHEELEAQQARDTAALTSAPTRWPDAAELGVSLRFIPDRDQRNDHSGVPITPMTDAGMPYRYKVRAAGGAEPGNWYASTPAEVLALVIDDYPPEPATTLDAERAAVRLRAQFAHGVVVQHVAQVLLDRRLGDDQAAEQWLRRSASFDDITPVLSNAELQSWSHDQVPLLLIAELYEYTTPPAGPKRWLHPSDETAFMHELAREGVLTMEENPYYTARLSMAARAESDQDLGGGTPAGADGDGGDPHGEQQQ